MGPRSQDFIHVAGMAAICWMATGCNSSTPPNINAAVPEAANAATAETGVGAAPSSGAALEQATSVDVSQLEQVYFSVPDMMCEFSCAPKVRSVLAQQPGVVEVDVDLAAKTACVKADMSRFDATDAIAALVDVQFDSTRQITAAEAASAVDAKSPATTAAP